MASPTSGLKKRTPGTQGVRCNPVLFFVMVAIVVAVFVFMAFGPRLLNSRLDRTVAVPTGQR